MTREYSYRNVDDRGPPDGCVKSLADRKVDTAVTFNQHYKKPLRFKGIRDNVGSIATPVITHDLEIF